jgi:glutamate synthase (ferredoxin)
MTHPLLPGPQGLYDPAYEHDACGVGFVVDLKGRKSHDIVRKALTILDNLEHRGACGCEKNTGDGAGILLQMPHAFLERACAGIGMRLPAPGAYGAGICFLPTDPGERRRCEEIVEQVVREEGQTLLGWRDVPTDHSLIGATARRTEPVMRQVFIGQSQVGRPLAGLDLERKLYVIRRRAENAVAASGLKQAGTFYVPSLSCKTLIYKGMLNAPQLAA